MLFHSAEDPRLAEMAFRTVQNSAPMSAPLTAASIAVGSPLVLDVANLPSTDPTFGQNYVTKPNSNTVALGNNLFIGALARVPGKVSYLAADGVGLCQVYGPMLNALVKREIAGVPAGSVLVPSDIGFMIPGTAAPIAPGVGGMAVLLEALAASAATEITQGKVFLRCM
jgi:hypothetical protein